MTRQLDQRSILFLISIVFFIAPLRQCFWDLRPDFFSGAGTASSAPKGSIPVDGFQRSYAFYVPASLNPDPSIIFVFHGAGGGARRIRLISGYEWERLADKNNLIIVYPEGFENHWNGCRKLSPYSANKNDIDDIGFIRLLVNKSKDRNLAVWQKSINHANPPA